MTEKEELERQVIQCRRLARSMTDAQAVDALSRLGDELEAKIRDIDAGENFQRNAGGSS